MKKMMKLESLVVFATCGENYEYFAGREDMEKIEIMETNNFMAAHIFFIDGSITVWNLRVLEGYRIKELP